MSDTTTMKYYIATKLENHAAHNRLRDRLDAAGHQCTYDWTAHGAVWRKGLKTIQDVAEKEIAGVVNADWVFVLWPGGRGTHVELGAAIAARKNIVLASDVAGHHSPSPETCAFYHHHLVTRTRDIDRFVDAVDFQAAHKLRLTVSIDRQARSWAVFENGHDIIKAFKSYSDEETAIKDALAWVATRSPVEPEIVFPRIISRTLN